MVVTVPESRGQKSDELDAIRLAQQLRTGSLFVLDLSRLRQLLVYQRLLLGRKLLYAPLAARLQSSWAGRA